MSSFTKREKVMIACIAILLVLNIFQYFWAAHKESDAIYEQQNASNIKEISKSNDRGLNENRMSKCVVYVCGNVKKPGVYELPQDARINDAINLAGGTLSNSDLEAINLAEKVRDGEKIYVPKVGEMQKRLKEVAENQDTQSVNVVSSSNNEDGKININTATKEELKRLYKIGDKLAERIIEYREKNGPFKNIEDIKKVSGIGDKIFEAIKDSIVAQ